ncbi:MAG TPA: ABC transporter permease [Acidobacteriota bacterium]|nr:ABC transporter permease [Acidobacteriota bacterium]
MRSWGLSFSQHLLRLLLRLYPGPFRRAYGREMAGLFRQRYRRALVRGGLPAVLLLWTRTLADILRTAWREHRSSCLDPVRQSPHPPPSPFPRRRGDNLMKSVLSDLRVALRGLRKRPGFVLGATLALALGIGANTAIFSLIHSILIQPLPYPDSHQLMMIYRTQGDQRDETFSQFDLDNFSRGSSTFSSFAAFHESEDTLRTLEGASHYVSGQAVTRELFPLLGVEPVLGRGFNADEDREGGPRAMVLSQALWTSLFGSDPSVVGKVVRYQDRDHTIVGVMPEGFHFPDTRTRFWVAVQGNDLLKRAGIKNPSPGLTFLRLIGRLRPDVEPGAAQDELAALNQRLEEEYGLRHRDIVLVSRHEAVVGDLGSLLWTLLGSVGLVLLIACANVANLSLSRASERRREMVLRNALGASRLRLVRQMLTESGLLAAAGAVLGVALAVVFLQWLTAAGSDLLPRGNNISLNLEVLLFTALVAAISTVLFGLLPALRTSSLDLRGALHTAGRVSGSVSPRLQNGLVVCQVALALVLLSGAGLLVNSFIRLTSVPTGFRSENLLTFWLGLSEQKYDEPNRVVGFFEDLMVRLEALPDVEKASYSYSLPFSGTTFRQSIEVEGLETPEGQREWARTVIIGPHHFETLGIPLLQGRDFSSGDHLDSARVAIINESMSRRYWPDDDPIGKRFQLSGGVDGSIDSAEYLGGRPWIRVVGVAADVVRRGYQEGVQAEFYVPHAQIPWAGASIALRTRRDPLDLVERVRRVIAEKEPAIALTQISSMQERMAGSVLSERLRTQLWTLFALLAASLAVIGVYGVMAFAVSRRRQEIGVRMALGAGRISVVKLVLGQGMRLALLGAGLGLLGALALNRMLAGLLYQVTPSDPLTYVLVAALLLAVAALACYLPARRASRIDPLTALRWE